MLKKLTLKGGPLVLPSVADPPDPTLWLPPGFYGGLYYPLGMYFPQAVTWKPSPSPKVELNPGDSLRLNLQLSYRGPAQTRNFYAALGNNSKSGSFDEWSGYNATKAISLPAKTVLTALTGLYIDIYIPETTVWSEHSGENGAVYVKIMDGITYTEGQNITPYYYDAVYVIPITGEFANFAIASIAKAA